MNKKITKIATFTFICATLTCMPSEFIEFKIEKSLVSEISQFNYKDAESACTAICIEAAAELIDANLDIIRQNFCTQTITRGKRLYQMLGAKGYTNFQDYLNKQLITDKLKKVEDILISQMHDNSYVENLTYQILKRSAQENSSIATTLTIGIYTYLIVYRCDLNKWIFYDSHRKNYNNDHGSGFHIFTSQDDFDKYLAAYIIRFHEDNSSNIDATLLAINNEKAGPAPEPEVTAPAEAAPIPETVTIATKTIPKIEKELVFKFTPYGHPDYDEKPTPPSKKNYWIVGGLTAIVAAAFTIYRNYK